MLLVGLQCSMHLWAGPVDINSETDRLKQEPVDPHRTAGLCDECHLSTKKSAPTLRYKDIPSVCGRCHQDMTEHTSHLPDIKVPRAMYQQLPSGFRAALDRSAGNMNCIVCHDPDIQCDHSNERLLLENPGRSTITLRGEGWWRSDLCYNRHSPDENKLLNAHDQINEGGKLDKDKCLICHPQVPKQLPEGRIEGAELHADLDDDRSELCLNCHQPGIHPGDSLMHLSKPSADVVAQINKMQELMQLELPLEPATGRVYCGTCHNPHEPGVIKDPRLANGGDAENRLRYPDTCVLCHDK